jgi:outer membrane protein assembly factor BamB
MVLARTLLAFVVAGAFAATAVAGSATTPPKQIDLPNGILPEGIAIQGNHFYAGSRANGAVYRGDVRTGEGAFLVPGVAGRVATGLKVENGRIFVSGANTGNAYVYDAKTGAELASYAFSASGSFINDVVLTKDAAWFTDSLKPVLYRVPLGPDGAPGMSFATVPLTGDFMQVPGFNVNGIDATSNGNTLIIVQSATGKLFTATTGGVTSEIVLDGGANVLNGDGILLEDRRVLYVVQNQLNQVAKIKLSARLDSGRVMELITDPLFDIPTTIAERGQFLFAVNARFTTPPTPDTPYWITRFEK